MPATTVKTENPTKNDLKEEIREQMIELLQSSLASTLDFSVQAKVAHWNVKGASFIALHELFDKAADEASAWTDEIAERIVQLGGVAEGTIQKAAKSTELAEYPLDIRSGKDHVEALSSSLAVLGKTVRASISAAADAGDDDTADLFTEVSRGVDKMLWFIEAHNQ